MSPFNLSRLPGGELTMLQAMRTAGEHVPGFAKAYIDTSRGRIFAGTPEYEELARAGSSPFVPPPSESQIRAYTPGFPEYRARYEDINRNLKPGEQPVVPPQPLSPFFDGATYMNTGDEATAERAGMAKAQHGFAAVQSRLWAEAEERKKQQKKQERMQSLQPFLQRRGPFYQR